MVIYTCFLQFHIKKKISCTEKNWFDHVFLKLALAFFLQNILFCLLLPFKSLHFWSYLHPDPNPFLQSPYCFCLFRLFLPFPLSQTRCFHLMPLYHYPFILCLHWIWIREWSTWRHAHASLNLPGCVMRLLPSVQTCQKSDSPTQDMTLFALKSMTLLLSYIASKIACLRASMDIYPKVCQSPWFWLCRFVYSVFLTQSNVWLISLGWLCSSPREGFVSVPCFHVISDYGFIG